MSRNESNIPPLLAARVNPLRPARHMLDAGKPGPSLRISRHADIPTIDFETPSAAGADVLATASDMSRVAEGLRAADAALADVHERLRALDKSLTDLLRQAARDPVAAATRFYTIINNTLSSIDRITIDAQHGGCRLLDGTCRMRLSTLDGSTEEILLPTMVPTSLGHPEIGFLTSLRRVDLVLADATQQQLIAAIVLAAIRHVESERRRLSSFIETVLGPLVAALKIAMENVGATMSARTDTSFADAVGRIRPLEILVEQCSRRKRGRNSRTGRRTGLRLSQP